MSAQKDEEGKDKVMTCVEMCAPRLRECKVTRAKAKALVKGRAEEDTERDEGCGRVCR